MIPLRDINPTRRIPIVTYTLIALNLAVFVYQYFVLTNEQMVTFVHKFAVIPYYLFSGYGPSLQTPVTSMFMHGGLGHLVGNLWFLHIFGDNVEEALGHKRYLLFYFVTGIVAVVAHALIDPSSQLPLIGASGAISGVLGAYVVLYPRARVLTWVLFFLFDVPAYFFLLFWFVLQVFGGFGSLAAPHGPGVAFFAHIGGFVSGVLFVLLAGRPKRPVTYLGPRMSTRDMRRRF